MALFVLVVTILPCLCSGIDVELTATPSTIREGGQLTLTCSADETITAASFYYNNTRMEVKLVGGECKDATNQTCNQQCSCNPDRKFVNWTLFNVSRSFNNDLFVCGVITKSNNGRFKYSSYQQISVIYPPTGNVVLSPNGTSQYHTGSTVTVKCQVNGGHPLASLTWRCKGTTVTGQDLTNDTTAVSRLLQNVDRTYHQKRCRCLAEHPTSTGGRYDSASVLFDILYPPTGKVVMSPSGTYRVQNGTTVTLSCQVRGGNPLATLTWQCKGSPVTGQNMTKDTTAASRLILNVDRSYHQQHCLCSATHPTIPGGQYDVASVQFDILYQPSGNVVMSTSDTIRVQTGTTVTLECRVKGGNPLATLTWQCIGSPLTGEDLSNDTTALSRLELEVHKNYQQEKCWCFARHPTILGGQYGRASVQFDILYKPIITLERSTAYINESLDFSRTCSAQGNPSPSVTWYRGANLVQSNGILSISRINRTDAGVYVCNATSGPTGNLQSTEQFRIIVQYGPDVDLTITNIAENGGSVRLVCTASGVPAQYTYKWRHMVGSTLIRDAFDHVTSSGSVSTLTIPRVTFKDTGTYVCEASNGYRGRFGRILQRGQGFLHVEEVNDGGESGGADTGVILVSLGSVMILLSLLILVLFMLRMGRFPCKRTCLTKKSMRVGQDSGDQRPTNNDQREEQPFEALSLEQVGIPAVSDAAGESADGMPGESSQSYEQLRRRTAGHEYEDMKLNPENEDGMPTEKSNRCERLHGLSEENMYENMTQTTGTGQDPTYVNTTKRKPGPKGAQKDMYVNASLL